MSEKLMRIVYLSLILILERMHRVLKSIDFGITPTCVN